MLSQLHSLDMERDIDPWIKKFDELDVDGNGYLEAEDMLHFAEEEEEKLHFTLQCDSNLQSQTCDDIVEGLRKPSPERCCSISNSVASFGSEAYIESVEHQHMTSCNVNIDIDIDNNECYQSPRSPKRTPHSPLHCINSSFKVCSPAARKAPLVHLEREKSVFNLFGKVLSGDRDHHNNPLNHGRAPITASHLKELLSKHNFLRKSSSREAYVLNSDANNTKISTTTLDVDSTVMLNKRDRLHDSPKSIPPLQHDNAVKQRFLGTSYSPVLHDDLPKYCGFPLEVCMDCDVAHVDSCEDVTGLVDASPPLPPRPSPSLRSIPVLPLLTCVDKDAGRGSSVSAVQGVHAALVGTSARDIGTPPKPMKTSQDLVVSFADIYPDSGRCL